MRAIFWHDLIVNYGVALHRTCYTIVCIVPWCLAVFKTSTASIQSINTVTGIPFCFSELLISFACDLELLRATKSAWDFLGVNFWPRDFLGFYWKPSGFFWVLTFGSIQSSLSLEIPSTPSGSLVRGMGRVVGQLWPNFQYNIACNAMHSG